MSPFDPATLASRGSRAAEQRATTPYTPDSRARVLVDTDGVRWTVREIVPEARTAKWSSLLTRPGYENGWLSFRSDEINCRIAPFPVHWRSISDYELERWCMKARAAARVRRRTSE
ncbi:MAG: hypothetical protein HOQ11_15075 [Gemmatimonadaceae bacterium]|nr:hypothetical protein [Gemmatimonadaceae bacterium]NUQ92305.1 hypothetical protein [Gemmatimonadaceae bacterium]NUR19720.1 hypothetical protein [Gemmatimonadaceae bacterium]NUS98723.1 hypothetical protein [Gemmatimonadaceae bacterium]